MLDLSLIKVWIVPGLLTDRLQHVHLIRIFLGLNLCLIQAKLNPWINSRGFKLDINKHARPFFNKIMDSS